ITRGHLVRAVLEGVAYNSRWLLGHVERFIRRPVEVITAVGGGARSGLWCQIHADVLDRVVRQARDPALASARGAALQASVALGHLAGMRWPTRFPSPGRSSPTRPAAACTTRCFPSSSTCTAAPAGSTPG